jgi:hypothetical protein
MIGHVKDSRIRHPVATILSGLYRSALCGSLPVALAFANPAKAAQVFFTPEPAGSHATLEDFNHQEITDTTFAGWVQGALTNGSSTNALDATFFFQQCFGGGMLDDIQTALGTTVPWVGGSASRWDQVAWATNDGHYGAWSQALVPQLQVNQPILNAINTARATDVKGVGGTGAEEGQSLVANGGQNITLKDATAQSHHAVLWVGDTVFQQDNPFKNVIADVYNTLKAQWAGTNFTIDVLFGDGQHDTLGNALPAEWNAKPGTAAQLQATIAAVGQQMAPNEQFLFFGFDHGGTKQPLITAPQVLLPGNNLITSLILTQEQLIAILNNQANGNPIQILIDKLGLPAGVVAPVIWNGDVICVLQGGPGDPACDVPLADLALNNTIEIENLSPTEWTVTSLSIDISDLAPVDGQFSVPEPGFIGPTGSVMCLMALWWTRRGRKIAPGPN